MKPPRRFRFAPVFGKCPRPLAGRETGSVPPPSLHARTKEQNHVRRQPVSLTALFLLQTVFPFARVVGAGVHDVLVMSWLVATGRHAYSRARADSHVKMARRGREEGGVYLFMNAVEGRKGRCEEERRERRLGFFFLLVKGKVDFI